MSAPLTASTAAGALADALDTAILGYGLLGPALPDPGQGQAARDDEQAHRGAREQLLVLLGALGMEYALSDPGAGLPNRVADDRSARQLAAQLEDAAAAGWRALLAAAMSGALDPGAGAAPLALESLAACAVRAYRWRVVDRPGDPTVPFPGLAI